MTRGGNDESGNDESGNDESGNDERMKRPWDIRSQDDLKYPTYGTIKEPSQQSRAYPVAEA